MAEEVKPARKPTAKMRKIGPDEMIYFKGQWVKAGDVLVVEKAAPRAKARRVLVQKVIERLKETGKIDRPTLKKMGAEIAKQFNFKKSLGYRFLVKEGVLGRIEGTRVYGMTKKVLDLYPDIFGEVPAPPEAAPEAEAKPAEPAQIEEEELEDL